MNQTLKKQLAKICQETHLKWSELLPMAMLRISVAPRARESVSPFELLYGRPHHMNILVIKGSQMHIKGENW